MENACEAAITSLEKRTAKLQQWRAISLEVGNQEVQQLESAVAALQQQQQLLQQHRMEALPAIETAAAADLKELKKERDNLFNRMHQEGEKMINSLSLFHQNKEKSWGTVIPSSKAKDKCKELWASLAQVKDTRKAAADELTAKLNDAFGEAEKAINEEAKARRHAEEVLNEMVSSLRQQTKKEIKEICRKREQTEDRILRLLEESCAGLEFALQKGTSAVSSPQQQCH